MDRKKYFYTSLRAALILILAALVAVLVASCAPATSPEEENETAAESPPERTEFPSSSGGEILPTYAPTMEPTPLPAIPERRLLTIEWPPIIRQDDGAAVRLRLEVDEEGKLTPVAATEDNEIRGQPVEIPNLYQTHQIFALARLDIAGMQVAPVEAQRAQMHPGSPVAFSWSIRAGNVGAYQGRAQVDLLFVPLSGGPENSIQLAAPEFQIEATNFLGLGGLTARLAGTVGALLGSVLGLDNVIPWAWRLFRRKRGPSRDR